jgi:hypothetical protein
MLCKQCIYQAVGGVDKVTDGTMPLSTIDYGRLIGLVGKANAGLARYDGR